MENGDKTSYLPGIEKARKWWEENRAEGIARVIAGKARAAGKRRRLPFFPRKGSHQERIEWFCDRFLDRARAAETAKEEENWLRLAFMATLKAEPAEGEEDEKLYQEHMERMEALRKGTKAIK